MSTILLMATQRHFFFLFNISKFHFIFLLVSSKKSHPSLKNLNFFTGRKEVESVWGTKLSSTHKQC